MKKKVAPSPPKEPEALLSFGTVMATDLLGVIRRKLTKNFVWETDKHLTKLQPAIIPHKSGEKN